jgi:hypothetical protein
MLKFVRTPVSVCLIIINTNSVVVLNDFLFCVFCCCCVRFVAIYVEFLTEFGDLPMLTAHNDTLTGWSGETFLHLSEYQKGTKEDVECSQMGVCNRSNGRCKCLTGFGSSNGTAYAQGQR